MIADRHVETVRAAMHYATSSCGPTDCPGVDHCCYGGSELLHPSVVRAGLEALIAVELNTYPVRLAIDVNSVTETRYADVPIEPPRRRRYPAGHNVLAANCQHRGDSDDWAIATGQHCHACGVLG